LTARGDGAGNDVGETTRRGVAPATARGAPATSAQKRPRGGRSYAALLGDPCEERPKWLPYVVAGAFALGAVASAIAIANFGVQLHADRTA
jgi:hypothetical protein